MNENLLDKESSNPETVILAASLLLAVDDPNYVIKRSLGNLRRGCIVCNAIFRLRNRSKEHWDDEVQDAVILLEFSDKWEKDDREFWMYHFHLCKEHYQFSARGKNYRISRKKSISRIKQFQNRVHEEKWLKYLEGKGIRNS